MALEKKLIGGLVLLYLLFGRPYLHLIWSVPLSALRSVRFSPEREIGKPDSVQYLLKEISSNSHQVGRTVEEYFQSTNVPREVQDGFKEFLRMKASKSHPIVEYYANWLLKIYWILAPFMVFLVVKSIGKGLSAPREEVLMSSPVTAHPHTLAPNKHRAKTACTQPPISPKRPLPQFSFAEVRAQRNGAQGITTS